MNLLRFFGFSLIVFCASPQLAFAHDTNESLATPRGIISHQQFETIQTARFTLHYQTDDSTDARHQRAGDLATQALGMLSRIDQELTRILGYSSTQPVVLRFLNRDEFRKQTGAPVWTNAMFFRGEITIPVEDERGLDQKELYRALRHEYVHALVADFSGYRCPAWLDEGLAQIIEGDPNPLLGPALRKWISRNEAMPLDWLENGFTTLNDSMVPAAYAQSLFITRTLINRRGFESVKRYLQELRSGEAPEEAFSKAFNFSQKEFENQLSAQIARWATSNQLQP